MNCVFRFQLTVKTGLIVTLALAVVFAAGCPKKQQDKSSQTPPSSASREKKTPKLDTKIQPPPAANDREKTEPPLAAEQPKEPTMHEPANFKPYESLNGTEAKINFITKYADEYPGSEALLVYKVLDDNDVKVRKAAMGILALKNLDDSNVVYVAAKALKDSELEVRQSEIQACTAITDPAVENVLLTAIADSSAEVRTHAIQVAGHKRPAVRMSVLKAGITSQYGDVKEGTVSSLIDASSPAAMDILIIGLKDSNPDFRNEVKSEINFLISQEFDSYDQAQKWWDDNRSKFDDALAEKK